MPWPLSALILAETSAYAAFFAAPWGTAHRLDTLSFLVETAAPTVPGKRHSMKVACHWEDCEGNHPLERYIGLMYNRSATVELASIVADDTLIVLYSIGRKRTPCVIRSRPTRHVRNVLKQLYTGETRSRANRIIDAPLIRAAEVTELI